MANRIQRFILTALVLFTGPAFAESAVEGVSAGEDPLLDPRIERRKVREAQIDSENLEVGLYTGLMSLQDFGVNSYSGLRFAFHVSEDLFFEAAAGRTKAGDTSFEQLNPGVVLLENDEKVLTTYNFSVGYNVLPGEAFLGSRRAFNNSFYFIGGAGSTEFAGDDHFTLNAGVGYRLLLSDWLSARIEMRDHIFELDLFGEAQTTQNLVWTIGLGGFF
ncbi:MAG: outer membrane beta-barrel domain-containing protein [Alcanivoracaceae bacterium]